MVLDIRGLAFNVHKPYIIMACIIRCYSIMHIKQVYVCSQKKKIEQVCADISSGT